MGGASRRRGAQLGVVVRGDELEHHLVLVAEGGTGGALVFLLGQLLGAARGRAGNLVGSVEERVVHLERERERGLKEGEEEKIGRASCRERVSSPV